MKLAKFILSLLIAIAALTLATSTYADVVIEKPESVILKKLGKRPSKPDAAKPDKRSQLRNQRRQNVIVPDNNQQIQLSADFQHDAAERTGEEYFNFAQDIKQSIDSGDRDKDSASVALMIDYYLKAIDKEFIPANAELGCIFWSERYNCPGLLVKDYDKAFRCFKQGAEAGDVPAMYYLAYCYLNGLPSTQRSAEKAAEWYKRGADYGDADCQVQLAILYHRGQGVKKDNNKAAELLLKANDYFLSANGKENATACYYLYEVYTELGNLPDAGMYLHRAAELGNKQAAALVDGLNSPAEKSPEIEIETENKSLPETINLPEQPAKTEE